MSSPRLVGAILFFSMASSTTQTLAADSETARIAVVTKEVQRLIDKAAGGGRSAMMPGDSWMESPLLTPADFPILTVDVDPDDPPDFVVAINGNSYQAGSRSFRVVVGTVTITVVRQ